MPSRKALAIAVPVTIIIGAVIGFSAQYLSATAIEYVVYGCFGLMVLAPVIREVRDEINDAKAKRVLSEYAWCTCGGKMGYSYMGNTYVCESCGKTLYWSVVLGAALGKELENRPRISDYTSKELGLTPDMSGVEGR